jgi:hypothetical protein
VYKVFKLLIVITFLGLLNNVYAQRTEGVEKYDTTLYLKHSPSKASLYSAVLPGLGQVYNKKYWKVPIIYAGFATFIYWINVQNDNFTFYRSAYVVKYYNEPNQVEAFVEENKNRIRVTENSTQLQVFNSYTKEEFKGRMEKYRRYRDMLIMGAGLFYVLNIIDATVDAYLIDYDISKDLTMRVHPNIINSGNSFNFGLSCSIQF